MSCVHIEQYTFEYGPRDYLHQFLSTISTLRGGRQRYFPLLIAKINETLPSMATPGYTIPAIPSASGILEEMYDARSQPRSSNPNSNDTTPFGSPPLGATFPQPFSFAGLSVGEAAHQPPVSSSNIAALVTCAPGSYPNINPTSSAMQAMYQNNLPASQAYGNQLVHPMDDNMKYEPIG